MLARAIAVPFRVTLHVMFALTNHWLEVPDNIGPLGWPDDEPGALPWPGGVAPGAGTDQPTAWATRQGEQEDW